MCHDYVFHDREAESGTAGFAGTGLVYAIEALKDTIEMHGGNTGTKVADEEFNHLLIGIAARQQLRANQHALARFTVLHRVFDQVAEDLVKSVRVSQYERVRSTCRFEG